MYNERATAAYNQTKEKILIEIELLKAKLEEMHSRALANNTLNWAHVGDLNHILNRLKEINDV